MALICNVAEPKATRVDTAGLDEWSATYARNEVHVEAGSAYFAQAFAEALGLVADLELHDVQRARLRTQSIGALLSRANDEYRLSVEMDCETGLGDHHRELLQDAAGPLGGYEALLQDARARDFVGITDEQVSKLASALSRGSYADMLGVYLDELARISELVSSHSALREDRDGVAWQEFAWKLMTSLSRAMGLGQAVAVLNIYTFRAAAQEIVADS